MGSRYKCGGCGKTYGSTRELDKTQAVPEEEDPTGSLGHGYVSVCECGHRFHLDDWRERTTVENRGFEFDVSTVFLNLDHGFGDEELWYETGIFWDYGSYISKRYRTREEAEEGHKQHVEAIENGNFRMEPTEYGLTIDV